MVPATMLLVDVVVGVAAVLGGSDSQSTAKEATVTERIADEVEMEQT